ncbi:hypothetical protein [Palleronia sp.]
MTCPYCSEAKGLGSEGTSHCVRCGRRMALGFVAGVLLCALIALPLWWLT